MDILNDRILPLFAESGKPDYELEQEIGLPKSSIYDWRSRRTQSYKKYVDKIARYFHTTSDYLLGNTDIKNKPPANTDEELIKVLNDPLMKQVFEKYRQLSPENAKLALAQLDLLIDHQDK